MVGSTSGGRGFASSSGRPPSSSRSSIREYGVADLGENGEWVVGDVSRLRGRLGRSKSERRAARVSPPVRGEGKTEDVGRPGKAGFVPPCGDPPRDRPPVAVPHSCPKRRQTAGNRLAYEPGRGDEHLRPSLRSATSCGRVRQRDPRVVDEWVRRHGLGSGAGERGEPNSGPSEVRRR